MAKCFTPEEIKEIGKRGFFKHYSGEDVMEVKEVKRGFEDINVNVTEEQIRLLTRSLSADGSDGLNANDFHKFMNLALERGVIVHDQVCPKSLDLSLKDSENLEVSLKKSKLGFSQTRTKTGGLEIRFTGGYMDLQDVYLNSVITNGVYQWCLQFRYEITKGEGSSSDFMIGGGPSTFLKSPDVLRFMTDHSGAASFRFHRTQAMELESWLSNVKDEDQIPMDETKVLDQSNVIVEADGGAHTLSFIVNGVKIPRAISGMPPSIYLGVAGWGWKSTATSLFFRRIAAPTPTPVNVKMNFHEYIPAGVGCCTIM